MFARLEVMREQVTVTTQKTWNMDVTVTERAAFCLLNHTLYLHEFKCFLYISGISKFSGQMSQKIHLRTLLAECYGAIPTWEVDVGGPRVQGQPKPHSEPVSESKASNLLSHVKVLA